MENSRKKGVVLNVVEWDNNHYEKMMMMMAPWLRKTRLIFLCILFPLVLLWTILIYLLCVLFWTRGDQIRYTCSSTQKWNSEYFFSFTNGLLTLIYLSDAFFLFFINSEKDAGSYCRCFCSNLKKKSVENSLLAEVQRTVT